MMSEVEVSKSDTVGQENAEKTALETEKLSLEKRLLQRQLSAQGLLMAWLQAASVPAALFGAILAFFVGFSQLRQGSENQAADRFDKALTRLASTRPEERVTGVSGLQLFLRDGNVLLQNQALQFLINGLSTESDTRVRGEILDVLADLPRGSPSQAALDEALHTAVERDRSLTRAIVDNWPHRIVVQKKQTLSKFKIPGLDLDGIGDEIPAKVIATLTTEQYLAVLDAEHGPFERLDSNEDVPLTGLSTAIQTLVTHGATGGDFENIYCEKCDFSAAKSLDRADFDGAYLAGADFAHVSLRGTSFRNADLGGTNFFDADLTQSNLRFVGYRPGVASKGGVKLPLLECAKLGGADLSGQPLVFFVQNFNTTYASGLSYDISMPRMTSVQLDASTKLDELGILTTTVITDDYLMRHTAASEAQPLADNRSGGWDNPLGEGSVYGSNLLWRSHGNFAEDASKYTDTIVTLFWAVNADALKKLGKDAFMLRGFIEQPTLKTLPLYHKFVDAVEALSAPEGDVAKAARAWSDKAAKTLATMQPPHCGEHPRAHTLLFDLGSHASTYSPE